MQVWIGRIWVCLSVIGMLGFGSPSTLEGQTHQWNETEEMRVPRFDHSSTLLQNGLVLVAGGFNNDLLTSAELYDPRSGSWRLTSSTNIKRTQHTATLLSSGKVLVAGGLQRNGEGPVVATDSAEIYDPETETWTVVGGLDQPRYLHTATLLPSGEVLVIAGLRDEDTTLASCELFDPESGSWRPADELTQGRRDFTATLLEDGDVLVMGGIQNSTRLDSIERYDADLEQWEPAGNLSAPRQTHTATLLSSGKVLVAGGLRSNSHIIVETYDPVGESIDFVASLLGHRHLHTAVLLPSSRVLLIGGVSENQFSMNSTLYDPSLNTWTEVDMRVARRYHSTTLLPSGEVLVAGGDGGGSTDFSSAEVFSEVSDQWALTLGNLEEARALHTATLLPNETVLVTGGCPVSGNSVACLEEPLASLEIYNPVDGTWEPHVDQLPGGRYSHTATRLQSGQVLIAGGRDSINEEGTTIEALLFDVETGLTPAGITKERRDATATLLPDGRVLLAGGYRGGALSGSEIYTPGQGWHTVGSPMAQARGAHTATLLPTGEVLVVGGHDNGDGSFMSAELFDPVTESWRDAGETSVQILRHTATLLPSGKVLVAGGGGHADQLRAELYDPLDNVWQRTGDDPTIRLLDHAAVLLPSGQAMLSGGKSDVGQDTTALYHPSTGTWSHAAVLNDGRSQHTLTVLASGDILAVGGGAEVSLDTSEVYSLGSVDAARRPLIEELPLEIGFGTRFEIEGSFRSEHESSDGTSANSSTNYPIFQLHSADGIDIYTIEPDLRPDDAATFWDEPAEYSFSRLPTGLNAGDHYLTATVAGVPSEPVPVNVTCSENLIESIHRIPAPNEPDALSEPVAPGTEVTYTAITHGVRRFQWLRNGDPIPDAKGPTYTTSAATEADDGTAYELQVWSGCAEVSSGPIFLRIDDEESPEADLVHPTGGERWVLSKSENGTSVETISWTMSDNVRVCKVEVGLLYASVNDTTFNEVILENVWPMTLGGFDEDRPCLHEDRVQQTSLDYTLPTFFPSGDTNSVYKIRLKVTDQRNNWTEVESEHPFFIVSPNTVFETLILKHSTRMENVFGDQSSEALDVLDSTLRTLAEHDRVQGLILDLGDFPKLNDYLYVPWDDSSNAAESEAEARESVARANLVLFGCHEPFPEFCRDERGNFVERDGIHDIIRSMLDTFPDIKNLVLVGDDRIIPMARIQDGATLLPESTYTNSMDLTDATTVGKALAVDTFLSDDPLAGRDATHPDDLSTYLFIPDLAVGRLVERPSEILTTLQIFLARDGELNLSTLDPDSSHKVQVTGYDFLEDVAKKNADRWHDVLVDPVAPRDNLDLTPLDSQLIGQVWGSGGLKNHLCGNEGDTYGIINLNGHATHYQEGIPGPDGVFDIQGVLAKDLYGEHFCAPDHPLDLSGSIIYSVGCHSGLPVAGSNPDDSDRSLDLPQTYLGRGAVVYIGNSGYGWGLRSGVGYSERLVEIFTHRLSEVTTGIEIGEAVKIAKNEYKPSVSDSYHEKTLMQWTLYGLPMYSVRLKEGEPPPTSDSTPPPTIDELLPEETLPSGVVVRRQTRKAALNSLAGSPPPYMYVVDSNFILSADDIYKKFTADGDLVAPSVTGCPESKACYYALNEIYDFTTTAASAPIEPYVFYSTQLLGISRHGSLWLGGVYEEEENWQPVFAELISNGESSEQPEALPRKIKILPTAAGSERNACRSVDADHSSLIFPVGELVCEGEACHCDANNCSSATRHRRYMESRVETFYFNNTENVDQNCDRVGPTISAEVGRTDFHRLDGLKVDWKVRASDNENFDTLRPDVWRVVVVYDVGDGEWRAVELEYQSSELQAPDDEISIWTGEVDNLDPGSVLTYVIQAVDLRGNVAWLEWQTSSSSLIKNEPDNVIVPLLADTIDVSIDLQEVDLELVADVSQNLVLINNEFSLLFDVSNLSPDELANNIQLDVCLPPALTLSPYNGNSDWACGKIFPQTACVDTDVHLQCNYLLLEAMEDAPQIVVPVKAPEEPQLLAVTAQVSAAQGDSISENNRVEFATRVEARSDAEVTLTGAETSVQPGETHEYTFLLRNYGPDPILGLEAELTPASGFHIVSWEAGPWDLLPGQEEDAKLIGYFEESTLAGSYSHTVEAVLPPLNIDNNPNNNTASATLDVVPEGNLAIAFVDPPVTLTPDDDTAVSFSLEVVNAGPNTMHGVDVTVGTPFPPGNVVLVDGPWTEMSLEPGVPVDLTMQVTVPSGTPSSAVDFTAQVSVPLGHSDPELGNNMTTAMAEIVPPIDLGVTFVAPPTIVHPGNDVTFTIEVDNPSIYTVQGVNLSYTVGPWLVIDEEQDPWNNLTLNPQEPRVLTLRGTIDADLPDDVQIIVEIDDLVGYMDVDLENNTATHDLSLEPLADLQIAFVDPPAVLNPGQLVSYAITLTNHGPDPIQGVRVEHPVPPWLSDPSPEAAWTDLSLIAGATLELTLTGTVADGTPAGNVALLVSALVPDGHGDPDDGNNTATSVANVVPVGDLEVSFVDPPETLTPILTPDDDTATPFTLRVANHGPDAMHGVDVTVDTPFPAESVELEGDPWTDMVLEPGAEIFLNFHLTVPLAFPFGQVQLVAHVNEPAGHADPNSTNNTDTTEPTVVPRADLAIELLNALEEIHPGEEDVTFTVKVTNDGPHQATQVDLTHSAADWLENIVLDEAGWTNLTLDVDETKERTLTGTVKATQPVGEVVLTVEVAPTGGYSDPEPGNNIATATLNVVPIGDLAIEISNGGEVFDAGTELIYTITLSNNGPDPMHGVEVHVTFPSELENPIPTDGIWTDQTVTPGAPVELTFTATIAPDAQEELTVTANILVPEGYEDPDHDNNTATDTDTVEVGPPTLLVTKEALEQVPWPGQEVEFTVTVTNTSDVHDPVQITSLEDDVHGNLDGVGTCDVPVSRDSGVPYTCSYTAFVGGDPGTSETSTTTASGMDDEDTPVEASGEATVGIAQAQADLAITKTDNRETVQPGETVTYVIQVTNLGPDRAADVGVVDTPPILLADITQTSWVISLEAGESETLTFTGTVPVDANGELENVVEVVLPPEINDTELGNNIATDLTDIVDGLPSIAVTLSANPQEPQWPEDEVTFTVKVENTSEPSDVFTLQALDGGTQHGDLHGQGTCAVPQTIAPGGIYECEYDAPVSGDVGDSETFTVTAHGVDDEDDPADGSGSVTVTIIDTLGPQVESVGTVSDTGDGQLTADEAVSATLTQLHLHFSEVVDESSAEDVDAYRLIEAGSDGILQTETCGPPQGDDASFSIDQAGMQTDQHVAVWVHGGVTLPQGSYRLWVCDSIIDTLGNAMQETSLDFQVVEQHQLRSSNFDSETDLGAWVLLADPPTLALFDSEDVANAETSGSVELSTPGGFANDVAISQCVNVGWPQVLELGGWAKILSASNEQPELDALLDLFASPDCSGNVSEGVLLPLSSGSGTDQWIDLGAHKEVLPAGTESVQVIIRAQDSQGPSESFEVLLDDLYLKLAPLHGDGFESGDTSMWSNTVP